MIRLLFLIALLFLPAVLAAPGCSCAAVAADPAPRFTVENHSTPAFVVENRTTPYIPVRAAPPGIRWESGCAAAVAAARAAGKPVLILYTMSAGCKYCDAFAAGPLADERVVAASRAFTCIKIDTLTVAGKTLADGVGVAGVPELHAYTAAGGRASRGLTHAAAAADVLALLSEVAPGKAVAAAGPSPFRAANVGSCPCHAGGAPCLCVPASNCARGLCPVPGR